MKHSLALTRCIVSRIAVASFLFTSAQTGVYAQIQHGELVFEGQTRFYMVFLPQNYDVGTEELPLIMYLHSRGWSPQQDMNYTKLNLVADTSGFIVAYPSAINKHWSTEDDPDSPDANDVGFINALLDTLSLHYRIDPKRVYASGYSQGGFMSYRLACQLSHRFAAIAPVAGLLPFTTSENCAPKHTMPVLHIHGTQDPWISINGSTSRMSFLSANQTLKYWTRFNNCAQVDTTHVPNADPNDGCKVEKISYTNCADDANVVYYKVIGGGHTWPGAGPAGYPTGPTNHDIDANVEILTFFQQHRLVATSVEGDEERGQPLGSVSLSNYPNPFIASTNITYRLDTSGHVELTLFDLLGRQINVLEEGFKSPGDYQNKVDGVDLPGGVYVYQLRINGRIESRLMSVAR